ncbi:hypothetical protein vseg_008410 [Gypsophila vaccaria]
MSIQKLAMTDSRQLTTFVEVDSETFKDVVQRLTGSSEGAGDSRHDVSTGKGSVGVKRPEFKLHERRQYKAKLEIIRPPLSFKQHCQELLVRSPEQQRFSPSVSRNRVVQSSPLGTPTSCFSGLSLVERETKGESAMADLNAEEEEKAIKERRFYLHPSPRSKPGYAEPELLSLFPETSPATSRR